MSQFEQSVTQGNVAISERPPPESAGKPEPPRKSKVGPARYRDVFAVSEFRTLFAADLTSLLGDQVAAVAVAVLLYRGSGSALLAALGYATAYVPWLLGGPLLAAWSERLPGRIVMVGTDLSRAILIGLAALPGLPLPLVGLLVLLAALLAPAFDTARSALLPEILAEDRYPVAMSLRDATHQGAQLVGFAVGGSLVLAISSRGALAVDALTFAGSALLIHSGVRLRPPIAGAARSAPASTNRTGGTDGTAGPHRVQEAEQSVWRRTLAGLRVVRGDRRIHGPLLLGIVGAAYAIVPEAIAPAYAAALGHGASAVGLIMAAVAAGSVVGGLVMGRLVPPPTRIRLMHPLALAGALPLALVAFRPNLPVSLVLFALTGVAQSYQVTANALFGRSVPAELRTRAFGVAVSGLYGGQAVAIVLAGALAQFAAPSLVVAGAGLAGALGVLASLHVSSAAAPLVSRSRHHHC